MTLTSPEIKAYSIDQLSAAYSIGRSLIYKEIGKGSLQTIKVGKRTLITVEAAESWINSKKSGGSNENN